MNKIISKLCEFFSNLFRDKEREEIIKRVRSRERVFTIHLNGGATPNNDKKKDS